MQICPVALHVDGSLALESVEVGADRDAVFDVAPVAPRVVNLVTLITG